MKNIHWGISTSVLQDKHDLESLLAFAPTVIEFYNYRSEDIARIHTFCLKNSIIPALHVPTPYDGEKLERFCPTGAAMEAKRLAVHLTQNTIRCAHELQALHVVVHFPAPYTPHQKVTQEEIKFFFDPVMECAERHNVRVLIENLSSHVHFNSPEDYLGIVSQYNNLGICLDVGHAHLLSPQYTNQDFISALDKYIHSVHFYNTSHEGNDAGKHRIVENEYTYGSSQIDTRELAHQLCDRTATQAIILEYDQMPRSDMIKVAQDWVNMKAGYSCD